jgi:hypothetical protein
MEWWLIGLGVIVVLAILNTEGSIRRGVARVDRKLNLVLKQMNITFDEFAVLSDRVRDRYCFRFLPPPQRFLRPRAGVEGSLGSGRGTENSR